MMFESAKKIIYMDKIINKNSSIGEKLRVARKINGLTQKQLANITGVSRIRINEIENNSKYNIRLDTIKKLLVFIEQDILMDDYYKFIVEQEKNINKIISKFGKEYLCNVLQVHKSTLERYAKGEYEFKRKHYEKIKLLNNEEN